MPTDLDMTVDGLLARADIACPTDQIQVGHRDGSVHVGLAQGQAFMDRDFVLNLGLSVGARSAAVSVADRDVHVALLSWRPAFRRPRARRREPSRSSSTTAAR